MMGGAGIVRPFAFMLVLLLSTMSQHISGFPGAAAAPVRPHSDRAAEDGAAGAGGGFISFVNASALDPPLDRQKAEWCEILASMHRVGMDTVIITRLVYLDENGEEWSFLQDMAFDPTERILTCADELGMKVLIGLWEDVGFDDDCLTEEYLEDAARKSLTLATEVWDRYHATHQSFSGWYISLEPWNIGADTDSVLWRKIRLLNGFYRAVTGGFRRLEAGGKAERKLVAVSAYFNPDDQPEWLSPASSVPSVFAGILRHSGVDVLMVQDGAGLRYPLRGQSEAVKRQFARQVREYFTSFAEACRRTEPPVEMWALLEVFEFDSSTDTYRSAPFERLERQMEMVSSAVPGIRFALFDFYHYMNPVTHDTGSGQDTLNAAHNEERQRLYQHYNAAFSRKRGGR